jgi:hypothetical protein
MIMAKSPYFPSGAPTSNPAREGGVFFVYSSSLPQISVARRANFMCALASVRIAPQRLSAVDPRPVCVTFWAGFLLDMSRQAGRIGWAA